MILFIIASIDFKKYFLAGGDPVLQSTVQVIINIVDVNDNPPIITASSYVAEVMENLPPGQSVLRVRIDKPTANDRQYEGSWIKTSVY